uniref:Flagellar motor rotation protein MotB n=1 Tax=uncultured bacterium contig00042 TaxID=1181529 RepID=A0A806JZG8_9BACT|nr:flagellar motor rotation protein MotB [uncultured bacterium contig00042]
MAKKKKKAGKEVDPNGWLATYSDLISLLLCFFVIMFNADNVSQAQIDAIAESLRVGGLGGPGGGLRISPGRAAELGNTINSLPSMERGRFLGTALRKATSTFSPEIRTNKIKVTIDERGLVITLAGDAFFNPASARINIEQTRDILMRLATYLSSPELTGRKYRIEGHTDAVDVDPEGPWEDNWQLSSERSRSVLRYLAALGLDERRFQIAGFADTAPVSSNDTEEGRRQNRRVDIIIIDEGHL